MHHQGAICTMVHKGDYVFLKIQGTLMIFCFGGSLKTRRLSPYACLCLLRLHYAPLQWYMSVCLSVNLNLVRPLFGSSQYMNVLFKKKQVGSRQRQVAFFVLHPREWGEWEVFR